MLTLAAAAGSLLWPGWLSGDGFPCMQGLTKAEESGAERPAAGALKSFLRAIQLHEAELKSNGQLANGDAQANGSAPDPGFHRCRNNAAVLAFRCGKVKLAQELIEPVATVSWVATLAAASVLFAANFALWQAAVGCLMGRLAPWRLPWRRAGAAAPTGRGIVDCSAACIMRMSRAGLPQGQAGLCPPCPAWLLCATAACCLQCEAFAGRAKEVILAFNYARISEAAGDLQDAVTVFKVQPDCIAVPHSAPEPGMMLSSMKAVEQAPCGPCKRHGLYARPQGCGGTRALHLTPAQPPV